MSFRPRIVVPDDEDWSEDTDLNLSPDLELLAQQLADDAAMLADRYPAGHRESSARFERTTAAGGWGTRRSASPTMWWSATAVAAASLLIVAVGWGGWRMSNFSGEDPIRAADRAATGSVDRAMELADAVTDVPTVDTTDGPPLVRLDGAETLLINVSGPELEAVLDLMETEGAEDPFLSI